MLVTAAAMTLLLGGCYDAVYDQGSEFHSGFYDGGYLFGGQCWSSAIGTGDNWRHADPQYGDGGSHFGGHEDGHGNGSNGGFGGGRGGR